MEGKRTMALFRNSFEGEAKEIHKIKKNKRKRRSSLRVIKAKAKFQMK